MAKIALSGPADLLATIPYQLGFRPSRSVVVVCFHADRLGLVARLDAAADLDVAHSVETLLPVLGREAPTSVTLASFEVTPDETQPLRRGLLEALDAAGVTVREQLLVRDRRWFRLDGDRTCWPSEGLAMPLDADVPAVAAFVGLGQAVMHDRESMARLVAPLTTGAQGHDAVVHAIEHWQQRYAWSSVDNGEAAPTAHRSEGRPDEQSGADHLVAESLACWRLLLAPAPLERLSTEVLSQLVAPLRFAALRDGLIAWLCPGTLSRSQIDPGLHLLLAAHLGEQGPGHRPTSTAGGQDAHNSDGQGDVNSEGSEGSESREEDDWDAASTTRLVMSRLALLCRETPPDHAAPLLSLLACYAWWAGDGALAGMAVDQALEIEADHRLSGLVRSALDHGLRVMGAAA